MPATTYIRRQDVESKVVLDTSGKSIGTAQDIAFSLDGKLALVVKTKKGEDVEIPVSRIVGVADYIVLTPESSVSTQIGPQSQPSTMTQTSTLTSVDQNCTRCGMPLKPGAKFCTHCGLQLASRNAGQTASSKSDSKKDA
jgi:sporulation protein YlmC with PRC-barrel domain